MGGWLNPDSGLGSGSRSRAFRPIRRYADTPIRRYAHPCLGIILDTKCATAAATHGVHLNPTQEQRMSTTIRAVIRLGLTIAAMGGLGACASIPQRAWAN